MSSKNITGQKGDGLGLTPNRPLVITARNTFEGIQKEYAYLDKNFPGYELVRQALVTKDGCPMDVLVIEKRGKQIELFFDIKSFFGKRSCVTTHFRIGILRMKPTPSHHNIRHILHSQHHRPRHFHLHIPVLRFQPTLLPNRLVSYLRS